jgi:integrase
MILYDLAARIQDLLIFRYDSFVLDNDGGGTYKWTTHKTGEKRLGYLSSKTMIYLKKVQKTLGKLPNDLIYQGTNNKLIKKNFSNFFTSSMKVPVKSHDFRTTKLTELLLIDKVDMNIV